MHDVAVVGAGPSGAWAATPLARQGARVLILDASHPREKPCGGAVTARALALVGEVGSPALSSSVAVRCARFLNSRAGISAFVPLGTGEVTLRVASRAEYDGRLLDAAMGAGAELVTSRVVELTRTGQGFRLADGRRPTL